LPSHTETMRGSFSISGATATDFFAHGPHGSASRGRRNRHISTWLRSIKVIISSLYGGTTFVEHSILKERLVFEWQLASRQRTYLQHQRGKAVRGNRQDTETLNRQALPRYDFAPFIVAQTKVSDGWRLRRTGAFGLMATNPFDLESGRRTCFGCGLGNRWLRLYQAEIAPPGN
jgi:hypothetical protein